MVIKVYHLKEQQLSASFQTLKHYPTQEQVHEALSCDMYSEVAQVRTDNLDKAFDLTNSVVVHWSRNPDVCTDQNNEAPTQRSTQVGDLMVIVKDDNTMDNMDNPVLNASSLHVVANVGWKKMDSDLLQLLSNPPKEKDQAHTPDTDIKQEVQTRSKHRMQ